MRTQAEALRPVRQWRPSRPGVLRWWRLVLLAAVAAALACGWFLWRLLDPGSFILGSAELIALPDGGAAVGWLDYSGDRPESRLFVVDANGRPVFAEELAAHQRVVGMAASAEGAVVIAEQAGLDSGSITVLEAGSSRRRDVVRPAGVPSGTEMVVHDNELLWISRGLTGGLEATDLATGNTRRLMSTGTWARQLTALADGRTVAMVDDGVLLIVDATTGEVRGREEDGEVVSIAPTRDGLVFVTKDGEPKVLDQCPGDSGPGSDADLRVGRLRLGAQGGSPTWAWASPTNSP